MMDEKVLRFVAEAYLLLHSDPRGQATSDSMREKTKRKDGTQKPAQSVARAKSAEPRKGKKPR
jgi:hypothetical protein